MDRPLTKWHCSEPPRKDHAAPAWLTASEFEDTPRVAAAKAAQLCDLLVASKRTVLYTGAGISASVVGQAARSGQNKTGWKATTGARPTYTHFALGALANAGFIHSWVQQNHDGLPQKAGFPQERINEIHGSWFDPSNPVVKYSGRLHTPAFLGMREDAETADLVLVLGTSLSGLNADRVAKNAAARAERGASLGSVIVNLQQTVHDGSATLRFFGCSDDVLARVVEQLKVPVPRTQRTWPEDRVLVPYDTEGRRTNGEKTWLDLRPGQRVRIAGDNNIRGSNQPQYQHIKSGEGRVLAREDGHASFVLNIEGARMRLGVWWLDVAKRGGVEQLPIVNVSPSSRGRSASPARRALQDRGKPTPKPSPKQAPKPTLRPSPKPQPKATPTSQTQFKPPTRTALQTKQPQKPKWRI